MGFGASGIWWALNVGNLLKLGAIFLLFRRLRLFSPESESQSQTT
jgi:Na+-driven multidrug efflux pump